MDEAERRVRDSFGRQTIMDHLGARLSLVADGVVEIELPWRAVLAQQDGFFHAGAQTTVADSAGGYAALTRMPPGSRVLTVELKMNFLTPARGERLVARGEVVRSGRTLSVARVDVTAHDGPRTTTCAVGQQTLICVPDGPR